MAPEVLTMLLSAGLGAILNIWQRSMENKELTFKLLAGERKSIDDSQELAAKRGGGEKWWTPQSLVRPSVVFLAMGAFYFPIFAQVPTWVETCSLGGFWTFLPWVEGTMKCKFELLTPGGATILAEHKQVAMAIVGFYFGNRRVK